MVLKRFANLFKVNRVIGEEFVSLIQNVDSVLGISFKAASLQNINTIETVFVQDLHVLHFGQVAVHHYANFFAMVCMVFREQNGNERFALTRVKTHGHNFRRLSIALRSNIGLVATVSVA